MDLSPSLRITRVHKRDFLTGEQFLHSSGHHDVSLREPVADDNRVSLIAQYGDRLQLHRLVLLDEPDGGLSVLLEERASRYRDGLALIQRHGADDVGAEPHL